jgi:hypothetical protein
MPIIPVESGTGRRIPSTDPNVFTVFQWRKRIGNATLQAIEAVLETTDAATGPVRHALRVAKDDLASADYVDVRDADTIAGVQSLVDAGLKSPEEGAAMLLPRGA